MVGTAPELCQKCDFFQKKRMKENLAYVLEFMLTFNKKQKYHASETKCLAVFYGQSMALKITYSNCRSVP